MPSLMPSLLCRHLIAQRRESRTTDRRDHVNWPLRACPRRIAKHQPRLGPGVYHRILCGAGAATDFAHMNGSTLATRVDESLVRSIETPLLSVTQQLGRLRSIKAQLLDQIQFSGS